ncbi:MAG: dienelactone hydrolase family protein [Dokdonella sp.]|uniref:dienelactone hydrolase family protein n=1 Tax=Dokdonella sp. TaxID=2291710 RepID=UPI0032641777
MGQTIQLNTSRMHCIGAYVAHPVGTPKGGLVVVQEIFGVNAHMRHVVDRFAQFGYTAIAPALFDHVETGVELDYDEAGFARGKALVGETTFAQAVDDVASAAESIGSAGKTGCVGYCWGGTVALLAAIRLGIPAVSYYGARNVNFLDQVPQAPLMFHFGGRDASIAPEAIDRQRAAWPDAAFHTYPAGHAFDREVDSRAYDARSAQLALQRTLAFLDEHLAGMRA